MRTQSFGERHVVANRGIAQVLTDNCIEDDGSLAVPPSVVVALLTPESWAIASIVKVENRVAFGAMRYDTVRICSHSRQCRSACTASAERLRVSQS